MCKTKRLVLMLTPAEKPALVNMAEVKGGFLQNALVERLHRCMACRRGIRPWDKRRHVDRQAQEVQHG